MMKVPGLSERHSEELLALRPHRRDGEELDRAEGERHVIGLWEEYVGEIKDDGARAVLVQRGARDDLKPQIKGEQETWAYYDRKAESAHLALLEVERMAYVFGPTSRVFDVVQEDGALKAGAAGWELRKRTQGEREIVTLWWTGVLAPHGHQARAETWEAEEARVREEHRRLTSTCSEIADRIEEKRTRWAVLDFTQERYNLREILWAEIPKEWGARRPRASGGRPEYFDSNKTRVWFEELSDSPEAKKKGGRSWIIGQIEQRHADEKGEPPGDGTIRDQLRKMGLRLIGGKGEK
jgi:hypothetical protein